MKGRSFCFCDGGIGVDERVGDGKGVRGCDGLLGGTLSGLRMTVDSRSRDENKEEEEREDRWERKESR